MSLVTRPSRVELGPAQGASIAQETVITAKNQSIPSECSGAPASHLETIAEGVRSTIPSKDVAERVYQGKLRQSSLKVYNYRWNGFCTWRSARKLLPWHATMQQLAHFLHDLFQERKLEVCMIERYKSTLRPLLRQVHKYGD